MKSNDFEPNPGIGTRRRPSPVPGLQYTMSKTTGTVVSVGLVHVRVLEVRSYGPRKRPSALVSAEEDRAIGGSTILVRADRSER